MLKLIYATSENGVVGKGGKLPWPNMSADLRRFYNLTRNNSVVMGRRTYESIGKKKLKERRNIVLSTTLPDDIRGFSVIREFEDVVAMAKSSREDFYIIGGQTLWERSLTIEPPDTIYRTIIHTNVTDGDVYEPAIPDDEFSLLIENCHKSDADNPFDYTFQTWVRKG